MTDKQFDKIREKLYDAQMSVDAGVWESIEGTLRRRRLRKMLYYVSSAAAAIIIVLILGIRPDDSVAETLLAEVPMEPVCLVNDPQYLLEEEFCNVDELVFEKQKFIVEKRTPIEEQQPPQEIYSESEIDEQFEQTELPLQEELLVLEQEPRRAVLAFSTGVLPGSSATAVNSTIRASHPGGASLHSHSFEQISDTKYSLPLNLGVQVQIPLKENLALGVGVNYTLLRSKYDCLIDKKKYSVKQTLHYVGIPVNVYGLIVERNNFSFYVNAGGAIEKGVRAVYELKSYSGRERSTTSIEGMQVSVNAGLGVEYKLGNLTGIYFEPNIVYFMDSEMPCSIRTDQPLQVKAEFGVRLHF